MRFAHLESLTVQFDRIRTARNRTRRAKRLEIPFNSGRRPFLSVNEAGAATAFVDIFLDDCYHVGAFCSTSTRRVLDIGANVGFFSIASRIAFPNAVVHAYEPNPELQFCLEGNGKEFGFDVFPNAIGVEAGRCELDQAESSVLKRTTDDSSGSIQVEAFQEAKHRIGLPVDLLKLDCEGAEWQILARADLLEAVSSITMEYHLDGTHGHDDAERLVKNAGFRIVDQVPAHGNAGMMLAVRV